MISVITFNVFLDFQFHNRSVCHVACEVIHLLSEFYTELCGFDEDLPTKILEVCKNGKKHCSDVKRFLSNL